MFHSFADLTAHLREFHKKVHQRLTVALNRQLMTLLDELEKFAYKFTADVKTGTLAECLEAVRRLKGWYPEKLRTKDYLRYRDMEWEKDEIRSLYGLSLNQMYARERAAAVARKDREDMDRPNAAPKGGIALPDYIANKSPEELTDEDAFIIARNQMIQACLGGSMDAAQKIVDRFQRFMQSDLKVKWEQVRILDRFFLSDFLPAVQKQLRMNDPLPKILAEVESWGNELSGSETRKANIERIKEICQKGRIDAKAIFRETLKVVAPEIKEVAERSLEGIRAGVARLPQPVAQPGMDDAVKKAKRRGKWKKPNPEKAEQIFEKAMRKSPGIMEIPAVPPLEGEQERGEELSEAGEEEAGNAW